MKIKETIERYCCHPVQDLSPLNGDNDNGYLFCLHCGRYWFNSGPPNSNVGFGIVVLPWPWEEKK